MASSAKSESAFSAGMFCDSINDAFSFLPFPKTIGASKSKMIDSSFSSPFSPSFSSLRFHLFLTLFVSFVPAGSVRPVPVLIRLFSASVLPPLYKFMSKFPIALRSCRMRIISNNWKPVAWRFRKTDISRDNCFINIYVKVVLDVFHNIGR